MYISYNFANPLFCYNPKIVTVNSFLIFSGVQDWRLYTRPGILHCVPLEKKASILPLWRCPDPATPSPSLPSLGVQKSLVHTSIKKFKTVSRQFLNSMSPPLQGFWGPCHIPLWYKAPGTLTCSLVHNKNLLSEWVKGYINKLFF